MTTCVTGTCVGMIVLESFVHVSKGQNLPFGLSIGEVMVGPPCPLLQAKGTKGLALHARTPHHHDP